MSGCQKQAASQAKEKPTPAKAIPTVAPEPSPTPELEGGLLKTSREFLAYLAADPEAQGAQVDRMIDALADTGRYEEAGTLAESVGGWRGQIAFYRLSEAAARARQEAMSHKMFERAERSPVGEGDSEKDEVLAARILAMGARGEMEQAREQLSKISSPPVRLNTEAGLIAYVSADRSAEMVKELLQEAKVPPHVEGRARVLAAGVLEKAGRDKEALEQVKKGAKAATGEADAETIPLLESAVQLLSQLGAAKDATRWANFSLEHVERVGDGSWKRIRDARLAALNLNAAGLGEKAQETYGKIPNMVAALDPADYSRGGMQAALAYLENGKVDLFHQAAAHVVRMSRQRPDYRERAAGVLEVVATYVRGQQEIPEAVQTEIEASAESIQPETAFGKPS